MISEVLRVRDPRIFQAKHVVVSKLKSTWAASLKERKKEKNENYIPAHILVANTVTEDLH